jgi:hypothetical protein
MDERRGPNAEVVRSNRTGDALEGSALVHVRLVSLPLKIWSRATSGGQTALKAVAVRKYEGSSPCGSAQQQTWGGRLVDRIGDFHSPDRSSIGHVPWSGVTPFAGGSAV